MNKWPHHVIYKPCVNRHNYHITSALKMEVDVPPKSQYLPRSLHTITTHKTIMDNYHTHLQITFNERQVHIIFNISSNTIYQLTQTVSPKQCCKKNGKDTRSSSWTYNPGKITDIFQFENWAQRYPKNWHNDVFLQGSMSQKKLVHKKTNLKPSSVLLSYTYTSELIHSFLCL
jgi:hypothetical protein